MRDPSAPTQHDIEAGRPYRVACGDHLRPSEQDVQVDDAHRFVELMPPGSSCSIALQTGYVHSAPGSLGGVPLNVDDVDEVHTYLQKRGSDVQDYPWGRFCFFSDPDGNGWSVHGSLQA